MGTIFWAVMYKLASSSSAADVMKNLITWAIDSIGPFHRGIGSSSEGKIWAPSRLRPLDSFWKPASECAARIILLDQYTMLSLVYEAR